MCIPIESFIELSLYRMALPKKGIRKINVNEHIFAWSATGNDGFISLSIVSSEINGQLLTCNFDYHHKEIGRTKLDDGEEIIHYKQQFIITPKIVKRVIEYALMSGWNPFEKGKQLNLYSMDEKINLGLYLKSENRNA